MFNEAEEKIMNRLVDQWSNTDISYDNVGFTPQRSIPFIRLTTVWVDTTMMTHPRNRGEGYIEIDIFVPANTGTDLVTAFADEIADIFNRFEDGSLRCDVARTQRVGNREEWYQLKVIIPFKIDECIN